MITVCIIPSNSKLKMERDKKQLFQTLRHYKQNKKQIKKTCSINTVPPGVYIGPEGPKK